MSYRNTPKCRPCVAPPPAPAPRGMPPHALRGWYGAPVPSATSSPAAVATTRSSSPSPCARAARTAVAQKGRGVKDGNQFKSKEGLLK